MRSSFRVFSRFAFLVGVGVAQLVACSSDSRNPSGEEVGTGSLKLPLQTAAFPSGNIYRLRNAFFEIRNIRSGENVAFLSSEDDPSRAVLTQILNTGDYDITLFPGWFLERVISSGGGSTTGGTAGSFGGRSAGGGSSVGGKVGSAGSVGFGGFTSEGGAGGAAGELAVGGDEFGGFGAVPGKGGSSAGGRPSTTGGSGGSGGGERTVIVEAQLLSDAVQSFGIFSRSDSFVNYSFQVGGEVLDFNEGRLNISIDVTEVEPQCDTPPGVTRPERVLLENDTAAVGGIRLQDVFDALASNGGFVGDGFRMYQEIYDSYASPQNAVLADAIHCGDEMTNGVPTLNGFPIRCDRFEAQHVNDIVNFFATAIVNRFDLAPANGANCGQQRMVFANPSRGRAFMILEAVVPNPAPELGIQGCMPLANFWLQQNDIDDPFTRGERLTQAFLTGHPDLLAAGFGPFYTATNLTVGSGQIRTNQFDDSPWTLREFKIALDGDQLKVVPFPTAEAPNGLLWDENSGLPQGEACRENFLTAMQGLMTTDLAQMSFVVDQACRDAESQNDFFTQDYAARMGNGFRATLAENLQGTNFSPDDIANRARFAGSCIGCHNESTQANLGLGQFAPFSADFVHVSESVSFDCGKRNPGEVCFQLSTALTDLFLPSRLQTLTTAAGVPIVPDPCQGSGGSGGGVGQGGSTSFGGATTFGGGIGVAGTATATRTGRGTGTGTITGTGTGTGTDMGSGTGGPGSPPAPAPEVIIELPQASEPLSDLVQKDAEIRALSGDVTISGRSAQVTH